MPRPKKVDKRGRNGMNDVNAARMRKAALETEKRENACENRRYTFRGHAAAYIPGSVIRMGDLG
jgi:hypothetical protein